jgi:hypothetical protein
MLKNVAILNNNECRCLPICTLDKGGDLIMWGMNEWMNEWMKEATIEWMNNSPNNATWCQTTLAIPRCSVNCELDTLPSDLAPWLKKNMCQLRADSFMNKSVYCYGRLCLRVCDVRESRPEFWSEDLRVGGKICSIHPVIRRTKPNKKFHLCHFHFQLQMWRGYEKNLKISCSMIYNSVVWKARPVRFSLLDRCANISFSISVYSPVLHRLKCLTQWQTPPRTSAVVWRVLV